jgi:hypothetical protein
MGQRLTSLHEDRRNGAAWLFSKPGLSSVARNVPGHFHAGGRAELIEAQDWYEREATGLGRRFRQAIDAVVEHGRNRPAASDCLLRRAPRAFATLCIGSAASNAALTATHLHQSFQDPSRR